MAITKQWIRAWAANYDTSYDQVIAGLGEAAPAHADVVLVVGWKSRRILSRFQQHNQPREVEAAVGVALEVIDPDEALGALIELNWVGERVASAVLAAFRPEVYTVMDWRAWKSLTIHGYLAGLEKATWRESWVPYLSVCRSIAAETGVDLRTLDRALFEAKGATGLPAQ